MNYKLRKLPNGVRLIVVPVPSLESATLTIWVKTGSRNETDKLSGISHFLEHLVFKGGKKRQTAKEIAEAVDAIGGEFNAGTSKEWTNFYIKAPASKLETAFDVLADMVLTPALRQEDLDREKGVIVEEIGMYEDTPLMKIDDVFENVIFKGHHLGRDIIGTKETITGFKRDDFVKYRQAHYHPNNILLTVAGGIDQNEVYELALKYFAHLDGKRSKNKGFSKFRSKQRKPTVLLHSKKKDQAHFILGFRASEMDSPDRFAETLLATILGGGMSSRLFTEIREKRGLAYAVRGGRDAYLDCGYISIYAGVDPKKIEEALKVTLEQCYLVSNGKSLITAAELAKAKEYVKGHLALSLEDTKAVNTFFGIRQLLLDKIETPEEIVKALDKVTVGDIVAAAKKNFKPERLNLAIIGPYQTAKQFEKILGD